MKTKTETGGKAMKTINNVQKTTLRSTAVIAIVVLSSFVLNAQGSNEGLIAWNSSKGKTANVNSKATNDVVMIGDKAYAKTWYDEFVKAESEISLRMERWMFNDVSKRSVLKSKTEATENENNLEFNYEGAKEKAMKVEDWMFKSILK